MIKTIVVTGGTKGIGRAIIERFAGEGFHVLACARNTTDLTEMESLINTSGEGQVKTFQADMSQRDQVAAFATWVLESTTVIDVLINNAGVFLPGSIEDEAEGNLELMIDTNLYSAYHLTRTLLPSMVAHGSGDIFNICSVASLKAYTNGGSYSISKFALYGFSQNLRYELKEKGLRVISVMPGATLTASWDGVDLPEERFIKATDVADSIWSTHQLSKNTVVEDIVIRPQLGDL
ncbi:SDR family oxidoreductase [Reichenbachiella agariperforans]|uniref:SDR family oxidoreductase n=1 Tax=Reichenbachiella agariperforans TaxID=156994 RepID=UPI001C091E29|nr:SDR family oxidoreductase [Reichenbachiella agariperforans]MBU2915352.1 SDR family oxidoreductase [Reichenbachiella agariperforans]